MFAQKGYILPLVLFGTIAVISGISLGLYLWLYKPDTKLVPPTIPTPTPYTSVTTPITDFESCAKAGNPIMESYPRRCSTNGKTFTEISEPDATVSAQQLVHGKTYFNRRFNYQLIYPEDWQIKETIIMNDPLDLSPRIEISNPCNYNAGDYCGRLYISIAEDQKVDRETSLILSNQLPDRIIKDEETVFAGEPAREIIHYNGRLQNGNGTLGQLNRLIIIANKSLYKMEIRYIEDHNVKNAQNIEEWYHHKTIEQILQSFHFLH